MYVYSTHKHADSHTSSVQESHKNYKFAETVYEFAHYVMLVSYILTRSPCSHSMFVCCTYLISLFHSSTLQISNFGAQLYDVVYLYGLGLHAALQNGHSPANGSLVVQHMKNTMFNGKNHYAHANSLRTSII